MRQTARAGPLFRRRRRPPPSPTAMASPGAGAGADGKVSAELQSFLVQEQAKAQVCERDGGHGVGGAAAPAADAASPPPRP